MLNDIENINRLTWAAPNGDQWVFTTDGTHDGVTVAEVFDAQGKLIGKVIPLSESRTVGFGAERLYFVRNAPKANAA